ncbi:MAG: diguanylate cyclase [Desulfotalea sp.]
MKVDKVAWFTVFAWFSLTLVSFVFNYKNSQVEQERMAKEVARSFFNYIVVSRLWNARHGGVYVPVTEETQPNYYLKLPVRDIVVNDSLTLTTVNPAFMTRQVSEIAMERDGIQFHATSLNPLRPKNYPSDIEKIALEKFEQGIKEEGYFVEGSKGKSFFYMAPLEVKKSCLSCHASQGYSLGDIRGGISVTLPFVMQTNWESQLLWHLLIFLFGIGPIYFANKKLKEAYKKISDLAYFDSLTGIANRRSFSEALLAEHHRSKREQQSLSVVMCDVDYFKSYNDTYGHSAGDDCLRSVAQAINSSLERPADLCARYGGEEFVLLLANTDLEGACYVAENVRKAIENLAIEHEGQSLGGVVTISLGVATSEHDTDFNHEELVKRADIALYYAKNYGRNNVQTYKLS